MTRQLVVIRHAKAGTAPHDIERPLTDRGRRDATAVGNWLQEHEVQPDRVVVSPAARARETWQRATDRLDDVADPEIDGRIYDNELELLLEIVRETPDDVETLVLVGHNPTFGALAGELDNGRGDEAARFELRSGFPTSAVAVFQLDVPWSAIDLGAGTLIACVAPRG